MVQRNKIDRTLTKDFSEVYEAIKKQNLSKTPELLTTGNHIAFIAEAKIAQDGRKFILLPHNNRIYEPDWGNTTNSMGVDGQRIGQYTVPLDDWSSGL